MLSILRTPRACSSFSSLFSFHIRTLLSPPAVNSLSFEPFRWNVSVYTGCESCQYICKCEASIACWSPVRCVAPCVGRPRHVPPRCNN